MLTYIDLSYNYMITNKGIKILTNLTYLNLNNNYNVKFDTL